METTTNNQSIDNKPNNSKLYIALGILAAAGIAAGAYFFMNNEEKEIKELSLEDLPSGEYIIQLISEETRKNISKMILKANKNEK